MFEPGECSSCGAKNNKGKFCGDCGAKIPNPKKKNTSKKKNSSRGKPKSPTARGNKSHLSSQNNSKRSNSPRSSKKGSSPRSSKKGSSPRGSSPGRSFKSQSPKASSRSPKPRSPKSKKVPPKPRSPKGSKKKVTRVNVTKPPKTISCRSPGGHFVDSEFPPSIRSLYWKEHSYSEEDNDRSVMDKYRWLRASKIFNNEEYHVFTGGIEPDDIAQGNLGDCYFLSALAAVAEFPKRIMNAFITKDITKDGKYIMKFCICGEFRDVVVDDMFPVLPGSDKPAFSKAHGNELWVMLLEKGWAKINGCYEHIIAGNPAEALRAVTGAPCSLLMHEPDSNLTQEQLDNIWSEIEHGDRRDYIMCSNAGGDGGDGQCGGDIDEKFQKTGLISSHAYSLIEAYNVNTSSGEVRLLRLRNPWGGTEWTGTWSDSCSNWTPDLKKQLNWSDADDGTFWMDFDDYLQYFGTTVICKIDERYHGVHMDVQHPPGGCSFVTFQLSENLEELFLTASQMQIRMARDESYKPSAVRLIVGRMTGNELEDGDPVEFVGACYGEQEDETAILHNLTPGQYIIYIEGDWKETAHCHLNSYTNTQMKFEAVGDWFDGKFIEYILISACKTKGNMMTYARSNQPNINRCFSLKETSSGYGCMYYENNTEFCTLEEEVDFTTFDGMLLLPPYSGSGFEVKIPPQTSKIVIMKRAGATIVSQVSIRARPKFLMPQEEGDMAKMVRSKGKKQAVKSGGKTYDIFWYSDGGRFLYENKTQKDECQVTFNFKFKDTQDPVTWKFNLKPGETVCKDVQAKVAFSYGYQFVVTQQIGSDEELHDLIKEKGKKGQVGSMQIFYYYYYYGNEYLWLYVNEDSKGYMLTCNFKLTNLALQDEAEGATSWIVELSPGASIMRKMNPIEPKQFNFGMSMSVQGM